MEGGAGRGGSGGGVGCMAVRKEHVATPLDAPNSGMMTSRCDDHHVTQLEQTSTNASKVEPSQRPATMEQPGLLEWCNATRFTMANDPGRELFQEQIQTHGFLFLTDYLDNILAGPRQEYACLRIFHALAHIKQSSNRTG